MTIAATGISRLVSVMAALRAPTGCPWDREQSLATLRAYLLEESYELLEAIDKLGPAAEVAAAVPLPPIAPSQEGAFAAAIGTLREELGDVLLQVAFQSQIAHENGWFDLDAVAHTIADKMVRRHPHVFVETAADSFAQAAAPLASAEVKHRWEQQKRQEGKGALAGVPLALPGLLRAQRIGEKAARIGFDWPDAAAVWPKVAEELAELREAAAAGDSAAVQEELGDLLFALASLGRHLGVNAELGLRGTLDRFSQRFGHVERQIEAQHGLTYRASAGELEALWQEAKALERQALAGLPGR